MNCGKCEENDTHTFLGELNTANHSLVHHAAKAATSTSVGWEAYDECTNCSYSTYVEIPHIANGFITEKGITVYRYSDGTLAKGWVTISNIIYYFKRSNGEMVTGVATIDNIPYVFDEDGKFISKYNGFYNDGKTTKYYSGGTYLTKWQIIDGYKYYFKLKSGEMLTGTNEIGEKNYVFGADGKLIGTLTDFVTESGKTKYYKDGVAQTGWQEINSKTYYFSKITANMITGEREIGGKLYVFNDDGSLDHIVEGFVTDENEKTKYYVDGIAQTGWQEINSETYYFSKKTANMLTGIRIIGDIAYSFDDTGILQEKYTGYYTEYGITKYYKDGVFQTKWQTINGIKCYFKYYTGEMVKGWATVGGKQYYFKRNSKGEMATGIVVIDSKAHSFGTDGVYQGLYTGFAEIDEVTKYFDNGVMLTKWQTIGGYKYYFKAYTGEMVTGNTTIGGKLYHFAEDGKLIG